jgi:hypothetical protein
MVYWTRRHSYNQEESQTVGYMMIDSAYTRH